MNRIVILIGILHTTIALPTIQAGEGFVIGMPAKLGPAVNTGTDEWGASISDDGVR